MNILVWMHRDLRLADHPALEAACRDGSRVEVIWCWSEDVHGDWMPGAAARWWLHEHLLMVAEGLARLGVRFTVSKDAPLDVLKARLAADQVQAVFWNEPISPQARRTATGLSKELTRAGVSGRVFQGDLLHDPDAIRTQKGDPYRVFTPFWRSFREQVPDPGVTPRPRNLDTGAPADAGAYGGVAQSDLDRVQKAIRALGLVADHPWVDNLRHHWTPGESAAEARLNDFLDGSFLDYPEARDRPHEDGTSRMSAWLAVGAISPRQIWTTVRRGLTGGAPPEAAAAAESFLREIGWREFGYHLLYHFPETPHAPLNASWDGFPWKEDPAGLDRWTHGRTGYAMVDAGMRQLWETGWMHNRVRMIVASFLTKDLLVSWQQGAAWFWDTLIDADLASNTLGWQWAAGCGADAQPFFRIFNPTTQGERHDPGGIYVKRWVEERRSLEGKAVHAPIQPVVDHSEARARALAVYEAHRKRTG